MIRKPGSRNARDPWSPSSLASDRSQHDSGRSGLDGWHVSLPHGDPVDGSDMPLTEEQKRVIHGRYRETGPSALSKILGVSTGTIAGYAHRVGLTVPTVPTSPAERAVRKEQQRIKYLERQREKRRQRRAEIEARGEAELASAGPKQRTVRAAPQAPTARTQPATVFRPTPPPGDEGCRWPTDQGWCGKPRYTCPRNRLRSYCQDHYEQSVIRPAKGERSSR